MSYDYIFNNAKSSLFMQVIPLVAHWIRMWSFILPMEKREVLATGCNRLEKVAHDLYSQCNSAIMLMLSRSYLASLFWWLIHVSTLCDPWCNFFVIIGTSKLIKSRMHHSMQRLGRAMTPFRKNVRWLWIVILFYSGLFIIVFMWIVVLYQNYDVSSDVCVWKR
jgi:hypothetical protein